MQVPWAYRRGFAKQRPVMRRKMTQVEKPHRHGDFTDVQCRRTGRDQTPAHGIEPQVAQVLHRTHPGDRLETVLQGPATHPQLLAQVEDAQGHLCAGDDQLLATLDQIGTDGKIATPATHLVRSVTEQVEKGVEQDVFEDFSAAGLTASACSRR